MDKIDKGLVSGIVPKIAISAESNDDVRSKSIGSGNKEEILRDTWPFRSLLTNGAKEERRASFAFEKRHSLRPLFLRRESSLSEEQTDEIEVKLKRLIAAFSNRTKRVKEAIQRPPTPSSQGSSDDDDEPKEDLENRLQLEDEETQWTEKKVKRTKWDISKKFLLFQYTIDPQSSFYIIWLAIVSLAFAYNAWAIPLRGVFPYQSEANVKQWMLMDTAVDVIYLIDILLFKFHLKFLSEGLWVKNLHEVRINYKKSSEIKRDVAALIPVDIFCSLFYKNIPWLRIPRILKMGSFLELFHRFDSILSSPHGVRIFKALLYMLYLIHLKAAAYYAASLYEGIGSTVWTFDGIGNAYIRCFYFATKTATSIGKNPKPENEFEYVFMTIAWLSGVFVFALLIGQIRDIIATATKSGNEYRQMLFEAIGYLNRVGVPSHLNERVKLWLTYTWEQQKTLNEESVLQLLPLKMQTDIALHVHIETLKKVKLFNNCELAFLRDLVIKLRSNIFLPGDFVCRKGEVGKEMYIVKSGKIDVVSAAGQVLVQLSEGAVFGEIALLGIGGMNRRTADVKSAGFANLFVLRKEDLNEAIKDYPDAQELLRKRAKKLMRESMKKNKEVKSQPTLADDREEVIIQNPKTSPKLIHTVIKVVPEFEFSKYLNSRRASRPSPSKPEIHGELCESRSESAIATSWNSKEETSRSDFPQSPTNTLSLLFPHPRHQSDVGTLGSLNEPDSLSLMASSYSAESFSRDPSLLLMGEEGIISPDPQEPSESPQQNIPSPAKSLGKDEENKGKKKVKRIQFSPIMNEIESPKPSSLQRQYSLDLSKIADHFKAADTE